jgi:hypothetical protein
MILGDLLGMPVHDPNGTRRSRKRGLFPAGGRGLLGLRCAGGHDRDDALFLVGCGEVVVAGDAGNDARRQCPEFDVAVVGGSDEDLKGRVACAPVLGHDDPGCGVEGGAGIQGGSEVVSGFAEVGDFQGQVQGLGRGSGCLRR